jgi:SAM-dependent methyltransferase
MQSVESESLREQCVRRWTGLRAAREAFPAHRGVWPDEDTPTILARLCPGYVCEVGCGTGRCAEAFSCDGYVGVDINPNAIDLARQARPLHMFMVVAWSDKYPPADTYLFHTTAQHVPDGELQSVFVRCHGRIVIVECMEPVLRGRIPSNLAFHRSREDYEHALERAAFHVKHFEEHPTNYQLAWPGAPTLYRRAIVAEPIGGR